MTQHEMLNTRQSVSAPRRGFLRNSLLLTVPAMFAGTALPAISAVYNPPNRYNGSRRTNVRDWGARGNARNDDTTAFQKAIDSLPASGGIVNVPAGTYLIDPTRNVRLRSNIHLQMSPDAVLKAKANTDPRAYVLMVHKAKNVEISGGRILGDRYRRSSLVGEWGHGIMIRGSEKVTVRDIHISDCHGDGISIGGAERRGAPTIISRDVVIANVVCTGCRRQGLTIGRSHGVRVYDSEFSNTHGALPECGIDIEPDHDSSGEGTTFVHIENCLIRNNASNGIQVYKNTSGVTIKGNLIEYNKGYGILTIGARGGYVALNRIRHNRLLGTSINSGTRNYTFTGNRFRNNKTRTLGLDRSSPEWMAVEGIVVGGRRGNATHIRRDGDTYQIDINRNFYSD